MTRYRFVNTLGFIGEGPDTFSALAACSGSMWANDQFDHGAYMGAWDVSFPQEGETVRQACLFDAEGNLLGTFYELGL
jgi:hypothetical protein